jgi:type IV secretion system protein VirD4
MRNYAGHRLAPWLAHVMVSRQETARPLLTTGEAMQLPTNQSLILIAGQPPIRAGKLRFYDEPAFRSRLIAPPQLDDGPYQDRPAPRRHDWLGQVANLQTDKHPPIEHTVQQSSEGGRQHQKAPEFAETRREQPPRDQLSLDLGETRATPPAKPLGLTRVARADGLNQSTERDNLLPGL